MATVIIPNFLTEKVVDGLNTYQYTVQTTAMHVARIRVSKHPSSTMTISILHNGSPVNTLTLAPVSANGGQSEAVILSSIACASSDTISFSLTSSASTDQQLNTVKATLNVHIGSGN